MEAESQKFREIFKVLIVAILLIISCFLNFYFHIALKTEIIYSHFFYLPIILSALWWKKRGLFIALFLTMLLLASHIFWGPKKTVFDDFIRGCMFMVISFMIAFLSEKISISEKMLKENEANFRALTENAYEGIIIATDEGDILYVNEGMSRIIGQSSDRLINTKITKYAKVLGIPNHRDTLNAVKNFRYHETSLKQKGGKRIFLEITLKSTIWHALTAYLIIVRNITERKKAETELKKNQKLLEISQKNLRKFSHRILSIREEEKKKLSINLHDEVGSMAVALSSTLSIAEEEVKDKNWKNALESLRKTRITLKNYIVNLKKIAFDLMPPNLGIIGLPNALDEYLSTLAKQTKANISFIKNIDSDIFNDDIAIALYRITQEALNNALQHAEAENIRIELTKKEKQIKLSISDDGKGFDVQKSLQIHQKRIKIGIRGMKERVASLGGVFSISSISQKGTIIEITIPEKNIL